jgi:hypothetical protein
MSGKSMKHTYTFDGENPTDLTDCVEITNKVGAYAISQSSNDEMTDDLDIRSEVSYNDFTSITRQPSFSMIFQTNNMFNDFTFDDYETERFVYAFPFLTSFKLYTARIVRRFKVHSMKVNEAPIMNYEVEFTHISNKLQKSGKAIEEYIALNCVGSYFN